MAKLHILKVRRKIFLYLLVIGIFFDVQKISAQTFSAAIAAGFSLSQIDGDNVAGYTKLGLNIGPKMMARISDKLNLSLEMLFAQKGSRSSTQTPGDQAFKLTLSYIDLPILINYIDRNRGMLGLGLAYSRLIGIKRIEGGFNTSPSADGLVKDGELSYILDGTVLIKQMGFNIRFSHSILPIAQWEESNLRYNNVFSHYISIRWIYFFSEFK